MKFETLERVFGLVGLALIVFVVALFRLTRTGLLARRRHHSGPPTARPGPRTRSYAVSLFGAAMTPYEVFFFSSGGVEEKWTAKD